MKLWSGRFSKNTSKLMDDFHSSISFDCILYKHDINGSIAHATMLGRQGIIPKDDADLICKTLKESLTDIDANKVSFSVEAEDIHMNIESLLIERIGEVGKRLHTGRSRNDQVALDIRLYMKEELMGIKGLLSELCHTIITLAESNCETIMPGYTHLQKAQPITLGHHFMAYCSMFLRDMDRLNDCYKRTNVSPLGSGALAGTTYPIDREFVAEQLGFDSVSINSLDGVSDRDFLIEAASCFSMIMMHLSRYCEELVIWSSNEFGFVEMDDAFSTGSSIMPQKKNPDVCELVRGKSGRVFGELQALLTMMKGLPLAYNKDMQEDKQAIFDSVETVKGCLQIFTSMLATCRFNFKKMRDSSLSGFTNATDAADYMVKKGVPFRDAHKVIGEMVFDCIKNDCSLLDIKLERLKEYHPCFDNDYYDAISLETCVNARTTVGGPSPTAVFESIEKAKVILESLK